MYDPARHHRRSTRLPGHDYASPGAYFITVCSHLGACLFSEEKEGELYLTRWGEILREEWLRCAVVRPYVDLEEYVVMPNHLHGILVLNGLVRATRRVAPPLPPGSRPTGPSAGSIGAIVGQFKSNATKRIREEAGDRRFRVWHRGFHEHVIRDSAEHSRIRRYIVDNPRNWARDPEHPSARARRRR